MFEKWHVIKELLHILNENNGNGIYAIKCINQNAFSERNFDFHQEYKERGFSEIIYIGMAYRIGGLLERLKDELLQEGPCTFFRSIGAVLKYDPLTNQLNPKNYKFGDIERDKIKDFMNSNFEISYMTLDLSKSEIAKKEKELIIQYRPIMNIDHNPHKSKILKEERKRCRNTARDIT